MGTLAAAGRKRCGFKEGGLAYGEMTARGFVNSSGLGLINFKRARTAHSMNRIKSSAKHKPKAQCLRQGRSTKVERERENKRGEIEQLGRKAPMELKSAIRTIECQSRMCVVSET